MNSNKNDIDELAEHLIQMELRIQRQAREREKASMLERRDSDIKGRTNNPKYKD